MNNSLCFVRTKKKKERELIMTNHTHSSSCREYAEKIMLRTGLQDHLYENTILCHCFALYLQQTGQQNLTYQNMHNIAAFGLETKDEMDRDYLTPLDRLIAASHISVQELYKIAKALLNDTELVQACAAIAYGSRLLYEDTGACSGTGSQSAQKPVRFAIKNAKWYEL